MYRPPEIKNSGGMMASFKNIPVIDFDIKVEEMNIRELRELARNLIRLARVDAELIQTMRQMLDLTKNQQGE
jgi:hypothetical protein